MTPTPSKPDLVALAEYNERQCNRHVNGFCSTARCMKRGGFKPGDDMNVATCEEHETAQALRHLASQPSLYEAGPCAWLRDVGVVASDGQHDECLVPASKGDPGAFPVYRGALPADGGEVEEITSNQMDAIEQAAIAGKPLSELPSTAGSVREAYLALCEPRESLASDNLEGALHDIERLSAKGEPTDDVCIRTIKRVLSQLVKAERALSAPVEAPVAVKPLRWVCTNIFGSRKWRGISDVFGEIDAFAETDLSAEQIEEKKAAAQADYEQRIRSALIATPRPLPRVDEVARTLREHIEYGYERADSQQESIIGIDSAATAILALLGGSAHGR